MWTLETYWYQIVLRSVVVFLFVFLAFRFWGRKHFGEMTIFDFIITLIISEAVQNSLLDGDHSLPAGMISVVTLIALNSVFNRLSFHSKRAEKIIEGEALVLIKNGKLDRMALNDQKITDDELLESLREQGVDSVSEVYKATLETNGKISVIKKQDHSMLKGHIQ